MLQRHVVSIRRKIVGAIVTGFLFTVLLPVAAEQKSAGARPVSAKDTLIYALPSSPVGVFHPTLQYSNYDRAVVFLVFDRLLEKDAGGKYIPSLAESYKISTDGRTYTFKLRKGIKWHDGVAFTAEDVAFTYETTCAPKFGKGYDEFSAALLGSAAYHDGKADHVTGVKVIDANTVSFTFTEPYNAALVKFIDKPVFAKHIWEKVPVDQWNNATDLLRNPVGTGPYKFVKFEPDQYVNLTRNDNYFKGTPLIKNFIFKVSNIETQQSELLSGSIDVAGVASWKDNDLKPYTSAGVLISELPGSDADYLVFNTTNPLLSDKRVRQAIIYSIDRDALLKSILNGHGLLSNTIMHPGQYGYPKNLNVYKQNIATSKKLLAQSGWADSNGDGILEKDGKPFNLTLTYYDDPTCNQLGPALQQYLKQVGINVDLVVQDFNTVLATLQNKTNDKQFDLAFMGATYRANIGYGASNFWMARYTDAKSVDLIKRGASGATEDAAKPIYEEWARYINSEVPMFILLFEPSGTAYNKLLVNYKPVPYEWFANVENWYFKK